VIHRRRFTSCRSPSSVCALRASDQSVPCRRPADGLEQNVSLSAIMMRFANRSGVCRHSLRRGRTCYLHRPHDPTAIKALVDAVRPKPINVLVIRDSGLSVADIAALGVRRISVGGALALAAWTSSRAQRKS